MRRKIAIAIFVVAGSGWFAVKYCRNLSMKGFLRKSVHVQINDDPVLECQRRNAVFEGQIESIRKEAHDRLKVGTNKADVSRFFAEHRIPFEFVESEAIGTLRTSGCGPLGCGTDAATIGLRVKLDGAGSVAQEPIVVGMYADCL